MCASAWNVDLLVYSDVFLSHKSYVYKCVQSEFGLWFNISLRILKSVLSTFFLHFFLLIALKNLSQLKYRQ